MKNIKERIHIGQTSWFSDMNSSLYSASIMDFHIQTPLLFFNFFNFIFILLEIEKTCHYVFPNTSILSYAENLFRMCSLLIGLL